MSQRPSASRPTSRSPTDGHIFLPPVQLQDENRQRGAHGLGYERQPEPRFAISTPNQHVRSSATSSISSLAEERPDLTYRPLRVHTMLNPANSDSGVTSSHRPSDTQSPNTSVPPPYTIPPISVLSQSYSSQTPTRSSPSNESFGATFPGSRRILTPRSPRIASTGRGGGSRSGGEQQPPISRSERGRIPRAEELLENGPPFPEPPSHLHPQQSYFPPPAAPTQAQQSNPQLTSGAMHQQHTPHSQSTSPSTTYSSYSQPSQTSSAALYQKNSTPNSTGILSSSSSSSSHFQPPSFAGLGNAGAGQRSGISQMGTEGPYRPSNKSSIKARPSKPSSKFQMMTLTLGPYQVPVDASSASRLADEKRARNAGASARFRQRRKEKEREASTQIEKLETQAREWEERTLQLEEEKRLLERTLGLLEEERDFYRSERDRFRGLVVTRTGDRELGNGPPSPRATRSSATYQAASNTTPSMTTAPYRRSTETSTESLPQAAVERAPRRRRTDTQGEFTGMMPPPQGPMHPPAYRAANAENSDMVSSTLPPLRLENISGASHPNAQIASPASTATTPRYEHYPSAQRHWPGPLPPPPPGPHDRR